MKGTQILLSDVEELKELLLINNLSSSPVSVVPILGMLDTIVTSLVRPVFHHPTVVNHFDLRGWINISEVRSGLDIIRLVYKEVDHPFLYYSSVDDLVPRLQTAYNYGKYLLVLDDLSIEDGGNWFDVLAPLVSCFANCEHGTIILVTSSSRSVKPHVPFRLPYLLGQLHLDNSLFFFQNMAFRGIEGDRDPYLLDITLEVFNKCRNSLCVVNVLAFILSSLPPSKWQYFYQHVINVQFPVNHIHLILQMMVQQPLNYYYSLFPLDHEFSKLELNQFWGAQEQSIFSDPLKEKFDTYIEKLLGNGLLFECCKRYKTGVSVYYKVQGLMHEVVKYMARNEFRLLEKPTEEVNTLGIQHVSFVVDSSWKAPSWLHRANQLKSLLLLPSKSCGLITIPNITEILANLNALQALDLAVVNCRSCLNIIGGLRYLRYLRLGPASDILPECVTSLQFLQTLDLRQSRVLELPEGFHKLSYLRHLYTGGRLIDLPPKFGELRYLQTLDEFIVGQNNGLDTLLHLIHLASLKIRFQKGRAMSPADETYLTNRILHDLSFNWSSSNGELVGDFDQNVDAMESEFLKPPSTLRNLAVHGWKGLTFPPWAMDQFHILLKNLVSIHVEDCSLCQHLPSFSSLRNLGSLQLFSLNALEWIEIGNTSYSRTTYFPSLKYLMLVNLPQLKGWTKVDEYKKHQYAPDQIFTCLSEFVVSDCPKLMTMPLVPSLEKLKAINIHRELLKQLLSAHEPPASSVVSSSTRSSLQELHIKSVHELESLSINISSLRVLTIRECKELVLLLAKSSYSLKRLEICGCIRLKEITPALFHNISVLENLKIEDCEVLDWGDMTDTVEGVNNSSSTACQGLKRLRSLKLTNISKLDPLPKDFNCFAILEKLSLNWLYNLRLLPESIGHLTQLRRLVVRYLPRLMNLPESLGDLSALEHVEIRYCPRLKQLPKSFPNLKSLLRLEIKECFNLKRRCQHLNGEDWPLIQHIPDCHLE